jgi:hypothetical protein
LFRGASWRSGKSSDHPGDAQRAQAIRAGSSRTSRRPVWVARALENAGGSGVSVCGSRANLTAKGVGSQLLTERRGSFTVKVVPSWAVDVTSICPECASTI